MEVRIAGMPRVSALYLGRTSIRDLAPLTSLMPRLRWFSICDSPIGDDGIRPLDGAVALDRLSLKGTRVTDAGMQRLSKMTQLTSLDLSETQVGDASIARLVGMSRLRTLFLHGTKVSDAGVAALPKALPGMEIIR